MCNVLYEDNHLLVVEKPPGLLAQGDATGDDCLVEKMKRYIGAKYQKPGGVYLGLVHRLDRPVGGLVALARTSKAAARLSQQLRSHQMRREYLAVVHGAAMPQEGTLVDTLVKDEATGHVKVVPGGTAGGGAQQPGKQAVLHYTLLAKAEKENRALVHIRLETGRKHQIRVQLAHSGHPIVQDMRYGMDAPGQPIALWGAVLTLTHPTRQETMTFVSQPQGSVFIPFQEAITPLLAAAEAPRFP